MFRIDGRCLGLHYRSVGLLGFGSVLYDKSKVGPAGCDAIFVILD